MIQHLFPRKALIALLLTFISVTTTFAQVTYTQGFEALVFAPTNWALGTTTGNNLWSRRTNGTFPTCTPHSGAAMARFSSHNATVGRTQALITPVIDYSALGNNVATFSLWVYRDTGAAAAPDSLSISVNTIATDSGSTPIGTIARSVSINLPDTKSASGWYQYTFNVPPSFNTNTNYIIIKGTAEGGNSIYIDDVQWIAFPPQCTAVPVAGSIVSNPAIICGGTGAAGLSLTGSTTGVAGISYQWLSGSSSTGPWTYFDSVPATNTGTITITTFYRCILTCSFSALSDSTAVYSMVVSPNIPPVVTVNPTNVNFCTGGVPVTLTASGAATYSWSPSTNLNSTTDSIVLADPSTTTRYTVAGSDVAGCSGTAVAIVNVRPAPALTVRAAPDTVCAGDSVVLSATVTGFVNGPVYTWMPDSLVGTNVTVAPGGITVYHVAMTSTNGCPAYDSVTVYANPPSVSAFGYSANGRTVTFTDSSTNATRWFWLFGGGNASTSQNPVYTFSSDGTDTIQLITTGLCNHKDTVTKVITVYAVGVTQLSSSSGIAVYPNPAESFALVEFNSNEPEAQLMIIDGLGQLIATYNLSSPGSDYKQRIDMSKMAEGIYTLRVKTATQNFTQQLIKQ